MIKSQLFGAGGMELGLRQAWIQILPLPLAAYVTSALVPSLRMWKIWEQTLRSIPT